MEIRDVLYKTIPLDEHELPIIDSPFFQRLRQIKQVGFAENSFPGANHPRYIHSLGAMHAASQVFEQVFRPFSKTHAEKVRQFRVVVRLAALLHDIGHGPLSHTTEAGMPEVHELRLPFRSAGKSQQKTRHKRTATHEDYTLKILLDSSFTALLNRILSPWGIQPVHVAKLLKPSLEYEDRFFQMPVRTPQDPKRKLKQNSGQQNSPLIDFLPILSQMISSELDCDRMDYLRRDSYHTGVSYGQFDFDWLLTHLTYHIHQGKCYLALEHRALYAFEDFLISRFHMFLMVYFHHKSVVYDEMLKQFLLAEGSTYHLPTNIEEYAKTNDSQLFACLAESKNPWAMRIVERRPFQLLIELHSGIPASESNWKKQTQDLNRIEKKLKKEGILFLKITSTGELSKYYNRAADPIFVKYDNHYHAPSFIPLEECTDLFERYGKKRTITRLYVAEEDLQRAKL